MGLIARAVEALGIPTLSTSGCRDISEKVKPPRTCFVDFPLGNSVGQPLNLDHQRATMRAVLESLPRFRRPGEIVDIPVAWPEPGWEAAVVRTYEEEAHIVHDQRSRGEFDADGRHVAKAIAEEAAGYCADCAV